MDSKVRNVFVCGLALVGLAACSWFVSWEDAADGGVGRHIQSLIDLDGPPTAIIQLPSGYKEYRYDFRKIDPSCVHFWLVDPNGIVVDYRYEGRCRPIG